MKRMHSLTLVAVCCLLCFTAMGQEGKPAYCDQLPTTYEKGAGPARPSLPRFGTVPTPEYKVQVAILRDTDPGNYPFHEDLIARYRPCEQVWVVESRESYPSKSDAIALREKLRRLGYRGAYLVEMMGYRPQ